MSTLGMEGENMHGGAGAPMSPARGMSTPSDVHPEQLPEARREQILLAGALESLGNTVSEVQHRLSDYTRDDEPNAEKVAEVPMPVRTPYGRALRESYETVTTIERRLQNTLRLLEL